MTKEKEQTPPLATIPNNEIVHQDAGSWYFWDETWCDKHGPYPTKAEAEVEYGKYCRHCLCEGNL